MRVDPIDKEEDGGDLERPGKEKGFRDLQKAFDEGARHIALRLRTSRKVPEALRLEVHAYWNTCRFGRPPSTSSRIRD